MIKYFELPTRMRYVSEYLPEKLSFLRDQILEDSVYLRRGRYFYFIDTLYRDDEHLHVVVYRLTVSEFVNLWFYVYHGTPSDDTVYYSGADLAKVINERGETSRYLYAEWCTPNCPE